MRDAQRDRATPGPRDTRDTRDEARAASEAEELRKDHERQLEALRTPGSVRETVLAVSLFHRRSRCSRCRFGVLRQVLDILKLALQSWHSTLTF